MIHAHVTIGSHFIKFEKCSVMVTRILRSYIKTHLLQHRFRKEQGRWIREPGKTFAYHDEDETFFIFHINCKAEILRQFNASGLSSADFQTHRLGYEDYHVSKSEFKVKPDYHAYDYQLALFDYIQSEGERKVVALMMGYGKTYVALKMAEMRGERFAIVILPRYVDKWKSDLIQYGINAGSKDPKDPDNKYLILDSKDKLINYLAYMQANPGKDDDETWCIITTITVIDNYIKTYYELPPYARASLVHPTDIWKVLRVGFKITDEAHEHFHRNFIGDLHTHVPKSIYLSATLDPSDSFLAKIYAKVFPINERMGSDIYKPYIDAYHVHYRHRMPDAIRCERGGTYSHVMYENYLAKNKLSRYKYFDMLYHLLKQSYLKQTEPNLKAIIFFSTVQMCTLFREYLLPKLPDKKINKYTYEDEYEELMAADIIISTPGSAGTGVDIPRLHTNICCVTVDSQQYTLQIFGRTREFKQNPGLRPVFYYFVADDLHQTVRYHNNKLKYLKPKCFSYNELIYDKEI